MLAITENQETQWLLDEIQRQPSVFVLSGPATVITNIATASAFLADGWSTESVSRVVRTARTRQENNEKQRAEHAYYSHIHDEVTISDSFTVTGQRLGENEILPEDTTAQDDQEDETEKSLSDSMQTRRQISRIHENMGPDCVLNTYEKHTLPAMNFVCWGTSLQRVFLLRDQSGETLRDAYRNCWLRLVFRNFCGDS